MRTSMSTRDRVKAPHTYLHVHSMHNPMHNHGKQYFKLTLDLMCEQLLSHMRACVILSFHMHSKGMREPCAEHAMSFAIDNQFNSY